MIYTLSCWESDYSEHFKNVKTSKSIKSVYVFSNREFYIFRLGSGYKDFDILVDIATIKNIEIVVFTAGHPSCSIDQNLYKSKYKKIKIVYWPLFWLSETFVRLVSQSNNIEHNKNVGYDLIDFIPDTYFDKKYICMNLVPKVHRCMLIDKLAQQDLLKDGYITWRRPYTSQSYKFKYWQEKLLTLDQVDDSILFVQEILPKEYKRAFLHVVTESDDQIFSLSEKTSIPLLYGKIFIVLGCRFFHAKLKEFGFKLYDECFDYSFDVESDLETRIDLIIKEIKKLQFKSQDELMELYQVLRPKIIHNKNLALNIATNYHSFPELWNQLAADENHYDSYPNSFNNMIKHHAQDRVSKI